MLINLFAINKVNVDFPVSEGPIIIIFFLFVFTMESIMLFHIEVPILL